MSLTIYEGFYPKDPKIHKESPIRRITGIVVHSTKEMFNKSHYFIDKTGRATHTIKDEEMAFHLEDNCTYAQVSLEKLGYITYPNLVTLAIGVEEDDDFNITSESINSLRELLNILRYKYNINKENILRHYDITFMLCPRYFVVNEKEWFTFLDSL
jgi:N-acetyl-anhydromuramyl-L-alanine amidase AmpD